MNTRTTRQKLPFSILAALSALGLMLAACGEQTGEQQSSAPTTEQPTEGTASQ